MKLGEKSGQEYDVAAAIKTFLGQMSEGGIDIAAAIIKELLQNADDAKASHVFVVLDERTVTENLSEDFQPIIGPALLVGNDSFFRLPQDVAEGEKDDFTAIRSVASGHKAGQATSAGRFGIGFNSVYFITDNPVIFSRREIHIFDLLHKQFDVNGWKFSLDDFPASSSLSAGPIKNVIQWMFPQAVAKFDPPFGELCTDPEGDYQKTLFRLPLRQSDNNTSNPLFNQHFSNQDDRLKLLRGMAEQAARSILFLNHVKSVSFGILSESIVEDLATIEITPPPDEFYAFLESIGFKSLDPEIATEDDTCEFQRTISYSVVGDDVGKNTKTWSFQTYHSAKFDDPDLYDLRKKLALNDERAIPWASLAIPLDKSSFNFEGNRGTSPFWRVFLPLLEPGPSSCVFSAALFVGPSRQRAEFVTSEGSDEALRKTSWNKVLVERALIPLLRNASLDMTNILQDFIKEYPKDYLSLFPIAQNISYSPGNLTEHLQQTFSQGEWCLQIYDIWDEEIEILVGDESASVTLEMIPEWLVKYRDRFEHLADDTRYFISFSIGDAVNKRLLDQQSISIVREVSSDVAKAILSHDVPPHPGDLAKLLKQISIHENEIPESVLADLWCLVRAQDKQVLRYAEKFLYLSQNSEKKSTIHQCLQDLKFEFTETEWIDPQFGLPAVKQSFFQDLKNVVPADDQAALKLLGRIEGGFEHDRVAHASDIIPVIDFLCKLDETRPLGELQLGFLVKTAHGKGDRRNLGVILLRPENSTRTEEALWEGIFRRTYSEVDPEFSKEINRLLSRRPDCLRMLQSPDCQMMVANEDSCLEIFTVSREKCADNESLAQLMDKIEGEMNGHASKKELAEIISATIIEKADKSWDNLEPFWQQTILDLPIHRLSTEKYINISGFGSLAEQSQAQFRLQSTDDLLDAPIELPEVKLLHHGDRIANKFYRDRLGMEEHGRAAVLKDILAQIGSIDLDNYRLLEYVAKYFDETVKTLKQSSEPGHKNDAEKLSELFQSAKLILCSDGQWRTIESCHQAWTVATRLSKQGWKKEELDNLLTNLFFSKTVASVASKERRLIEKISELSPVEEREIIKFAISSNSHDLTFAQRIKIAAANWDESFSDFEPSEVVQSLMIKTLTGECELGKTVLLDVKGSEFPREVARYFVPHAVDLEAFHKRYNISFPLANKVLSAFGIKKISADDLKKTIISRFAQLWPDISSVQTRLNLLSYIGKCRNIIESLKKDAAELDVVCISIKDDQWSTPDIIVSPKWCKTNPPLLVAEQLSDDCENSLVHLVWDNWCGLNDAPSVLREVISAANDLHEDEKQQGAQALYKWLANIFSDHKIVSDTDFVQLLYDYRWVLAQKDGDVSFREAKDVLLHKGQDLLRKEFWVSACNIPKSLQKQKKDLDFQIEPIANEDNVRAIGHCLLAATQKDSDSLVAVYELAVNLLKQNDELTHIWKEIAADKNVFFLFREAEVKANSKQLFLGNKEFPEDIGGKLFCLKATKKIPSGIQSLYGKLGVNKCPSLNQILWALSNLSDDYKKEKIVYQHLVNLLDSIPDSQPLVNDFDLKVLSCAGTLESLQNCYFDNDLGRPENVKGDGRKFVINSKDRTTKKLIKWIEENVSTKIIRLNNIAKTRLQGDPDEVKLNPLITQILGPWEDFIREVTREGSLLQDELVKIGINVPATPVQISAADNLLLEFFLPDNQIIHQSDKWQGVPAFFDNREKLFVQYSFMEKSKTDSVFDFNKLDAFIAEEVCKWLVAGSQGGDPLSSKELTDLIINSLERPSNLLSQIRRDNQNHFFHQYNDQVADPQFAKLFEQYRKTKEGSSQHKQLADQMEKILLRENVKARRDDIRGYGYDEFSVFAELVQNAEDAYVQRDWLKMDEPPSYSVSFKYQCGREEGNLNLSVEHYGRPFNYWRHGALENENLKRDVEGVLRSKGSYKPHGVHTSNEKTIGRFGLGFKSVFLVTDRPIVHSDNWHFSIEACCLPKEQEPPADLPGGATRIILPLNDNGDEINDRNGRQLINIVPFLKKVDSLDLECSDGSKLNLTIKKSNVVISESTRTVVENVYIEGTSHTRGNKVRFLRFRHPDHNGQLAICLSEKLHPVPWDEAFSNDFFVVLPLKVKLGCGVAISHLFEIQSGRTHLIDHQGNKLRVQQVAELISSFPQAIKILLAEGNNLNEILVDFWSIWKWDAGDSEGTALRKSLAEQLVLLAEKNEVVPTLGRNNAVQVGGNVLFYFARNIPDEFIDALVKSNVEFLDCRGEKNSLTPDNVVPARFAKSFVRTCSFAEIDEPDNFLRITWEEIGTAFSGSNFFAEFPDLLDILAEHLPATQYGNIRNWLSECLVRGVDGTGNRLDVCPKTLLRSNFPGLENLPKRLLTYLDTCYSPKAVDLLLDAGLLDCPPATQVQKWIENKELDFDECNNILTYFLEDGRFRKHFHTLKSSLITEWIPHEGTFITVSEAKEESLLDEDLFDDDEFSAWLGLLEGGRVEENDDSDVPGEPEFDAKEWLENLWDWWSINGDDFTREYEKGVYPQGKPLDLQIDFFPSDRSARREWLSLFLLGSFHTMGWYKPGAHRNFLSKCDNKGWLQVFSDPDVDAARWIDVLESYLDDQIGEAQYYHWVKQFVSIFQLARWLDGYVDLFLDMGNYTQEFSINELLISRESVVQQRGGVDAPPLTKTLGIGANFVIRELMRNQIIEQPLAHKHSFVPIKRVRKLMKRLGCKGLDERSGAKTNQSVTIYNFLVENLGEKKATFENSFDLPLLAVAEGKAPDLELDLPVFSEGMGGVSGMGYTGASRDSGEWVTLSDGRKVPLSNPRY